MEAGKITITTADEGKLLLDITEMDKVDVYRSLNLLMNALLNIELQSNPVLKQYSREHLLGEIFIKSMDNDSILQIDKLRLDVRLDEEGGQ